MFVFVGSHLRKAEDCIVTLEAVIVGLFAIVVARIYATVLRRRVLLEAGGVNAVHLDMLQGIYLSVINRKFDSSLPGDGERRLY